MTETERIALMKRNLEKSSQAMNDARLLIDNDRLYAALNRLYYAAFYCVSVFALEKAFPPPNTSNYWAGLIKTLFIPD